MDVSVDEENVPRYNPEAFYPASPGDVLDGRFELLAKLGWGTSRVGNLSTSIYQPLR